MEETDESTSSPERSWSSYLDELVATVCHGLELLPTDDPLSAAPSGTDGPSVPAEIPGDGNEVFFNTPFCGVGLPQGMSCRHKIIDPTSSSPGGPSSNPKKKKKKKKLYEFDHPFDDECHERKRLNAIKAKKHREVAKQREAALRENFRGVLSENEDLRSQVKAAGEREEQLKRKITEFRDKLLSLIETLCC
ncbi:uncharacterized protein LOC135202033 [Macrobrachium nipponense]|uniref:uncharacterized protein LOC135202033 n=1 Tax=Macrobrachium nipponense TaxID=159736 RepID=UPI0030C84BA0